jgi:predicted DNA-binding protein with PD1-like motif
VAILSHLRHIVARYTIRIFWDVHASHCDQMLGYNGALQRTQYRRGVASSALHLEARVIYLHDRHKQQVIMKYSEARHGRVFILRLEHGEVLHEVIERFAREKQIRAAAVIVVGGADSASRLVVGPEDGDARPVKPMELVLDAAHEVAGTGTLFPDETGAPMLHLHIAAGRKDHAVTGCVRNGVVVWQVLEVVMFELTGTAAIRRRDPTLGFKLLDPS